MKNGNGSLDMCRFYSAKHSEAGAIIITEVTEVRRHKGVLNRLVYDAVKK